jgi:hypothetical protein
MGRENQKRRKVTIREPGEAGQNGAPREGDGNSERSTTTRNQPLGGLAVARLGKSKSLSPGSHRISIVYRRALRKVKAL